MSSRTDDSTLRWRRIGVLYVNLSNSIESVTTMRLRKPENGSHTQKKWRIVTHRGEGARDGQIVPVDLLGTGLNGADETLAGVGLHVGQRQVAVAARPERPGRRRRGAGHVCAIGSWFFSFV